MHLFDPGQVRQYHLTPFAGAFDGQCAGSQEALDERMVERDIVEPLERDVPAGAGKNSRPDDNALRRHHITCRDPPQPRPQAGEKEQGRRSRDEDPLRRVLERARRYRQYTEQGQAENDDKRADRRDQPDPVWMEV